MLTLGMLGLGLLLDAEVLHLFHPSAGEFGLAFVVTAVAFAVGEAVVLHVELGRNAHTVSLAELTLADVNDPGRYSGLWIPCVLGILVGVIRIAGPGWRD
jgi:hypothetical protein